MKHFVSLLFYSLFVLTAWSQVPEKAEDISPLLVGEVLPEAILLDSSGNEVELQKLLKKAPTVLVFYRGGWCPYCNDQLSALADSEEEILKLGYQIIAISPDNYKNLQPTIEKDKVKYQVFADANASFIKNIGIGFKTPESAKGYIFNKTNFEASEVLPVPTVMVVNKKGQILFEYINPNYKVRLEKDLLLAVLKSLNP